MDEIKRIGFAGLGKMGFHMAGHLLRAGFDVKVHDIRPEVVDAFVAQHGGTRAGTLAGVAQDVDAVVLMLPTGAHVRDAVLGTDADPGMRDALRPGLVVVDMGSSSPVQTRALEERVRERGVKVIDAPVAGGVVFARDATLDVLVGGEAAVIERCRPVLLAMGRNVQPCGDLGNAHAMKALNNFVNASSLATLLEALTIGKKLGLDVGMMIDSMSAATTGRNHPLQKKVVPQVLTRKFGAGGPIGIISKDVRIALDSALAVGAWAPVAEACSALWDEAKERYGADRDQTEVVRLWEERTGITLGGNAT